MEKKTRWVALSQPALGRFDFGETFIQITKANRKNGW
jgi:hypothetical protein